MHLSVSLSDQPLPYALTNQSLYLLSDSFRKTKSFSSFEFVQLNFILTFSLECCI